MKNQPIRTTIEIYWHRASFPSNDVHDLHTTMNLRGFSRKECATTQGPDLWIRETAGNLTSWRWLESLCKQYDACGFYIRPEYQY